MGLGMGMGMGMGTDVFTTRCLVPAVEDLPIAPPADTHRGTYLGDSAGYAFRGNHVAHRSWAAQYWTNSGPSCSAACRGSE